MLILQFLSCFHPSLISVPDAENTIVHLQLESSKLQSPVTSNPFNAVIQHYHTISSSCTIFPKVVSGLCLCPLLATTGPQHLTEALNFQRWTHSMWSICQSLSGSTLRLPHFATVGESLCPCQQH